MIDADDAAPFVLARVRQHGVQVDDGDPVTYDDEHRVRLQGAVPGLIPGDHLVELARVVDHMDEVGVANARHRRMFPSCRSADQRILCRDSNRISGPDGHFRWLHVHLDQSGGPIP